MQKPTLEQCIFQTKKKGKWYAKLWSNESFRFEDKKQAEEIAQYWLDNHPVFKNVL